VRERREEKGSNSKILYFDTYREVASLVIISQDLHFSSRTLPLLLSPSSLPLVSPLPGIVDTEVKTELLLV
jgi:hypothetical protein